MASSGLQVLGAAEHCEDLRPCPALRAGSGICREREATISYMNAEYSKGAMPYLLNGHDATLHYLQRLRLM